MVETAAQGETEGARANVAVGGMNDQFAWLDKLPLLDKWRQVQTGNWWCTDTSQPDLRWHVSYERANTLGSVTGQILTEDGWYWYTANYSNSKSTFSEMVGPFNSWVAAAIHCEKANKPAVPR